MQQASTSRAPSRGLQKGNLVANAVARATMRSHVRSVGIELFLTKEGEQAKGLLSHLAWIVGMGAEIALQELEGSETARHQHTVLRNLVQLAVNDCRWRAVLAEPIWAAVQEASELLMRFPLAGLRAQAGADFLAARVRTGAVLLDDVAGVELYQGAVN
jgi:hypothetical protein